MPGTFPAAFWKIPFIRVEWIFCFDRFGQRQRTFLSIDPEKSGLFSGCRKIFLTIDQVPMLETRVCCAEKRA